MLADDDDAEADTGARTELAKDARAPPPLMKQKANSAPASMMASRTGSRRASRDASPRGERGRLRRAISFSRLQPGPSSPGHKAIRKHTPAASFGKAPVQRASVAPAQGPEVHSYAPFSSFSTLKQTATAFGSLPPPPKPAESADAGFAAPTSTLNKSKSASFGKAPLRRASAAHPQGPEVHSYAPYSSFSTLKTSGAGSFGRAPAPRELAAAKEGTVAPVASYSGLYSSFTAKGGVMPKYGRPEATRTLCPSHSYGALASTLKTSGVAGWGAKPSAANLLAKSAAALPPIAPVAVAAC